MLEEGELGQLLRDLQIPPVGCKQVREVRNSPPVRRVGGRKNVCIRFPSRKMGHTIQAESRNVEYPFVLSCEFDDDVLEYWDQPLTLKLAYEGPDGRRRAHRHTVDFLVITRSGLTLVECKTSDELQKLERKNPARYRRDSDGNWISPAGTAAAEKFGFSYKVHTPALISPTFSRNAEFLLDYLSEELDERYESETAPLITRLTELRSASVAQIAEETENVDVVYWAIVRRHVYADLAATLLCHPEEAHIHTDAVHCAAHKQLQGQTKNLCTSAVSLVPGDSLVWDDHPWCVVNISAGSVYLQNPSEELLCLTFGQVSQLIDNGKIRANTPTRRPDRTYEILLTASTSDLDTANQRLAAIEAADSGQPPPEVNGAEPSVRTVRAWKRKYRDAEAIHGNGYLGLIPKVRHRGNRTSRLSGEQLSILNQSIADDFASNVHRNVISAYTYYIDRCEEALVEPVSYTTYNAHVKRRAAVDVLAAREGEKAAYQLSPPLPRDAHTLPEHGDRAFEVGHVDHTELEISLVSQMTGEELGRPWLTLLIDAYSRSVLGHYIAFDPPSSASVMMVIRNCVWRHNRLPQRMVFDQGAEFNSVYVETLLASYSIGKVSRPPGKARFGSTIERNFGISQSVFIHNLIGNTQNLSLKRSLSRTHDPRRLAVWTPDRFLETLEEWFYSVYPKTRSRGVHETVAERFTRSLHNTGRREFRHIPYDDTFIVGTLPSPRSTPKVRNGGITVNHFSYSGPELARFTGRDASFEVKYDPHDISYIYAFIEGQWTKLRCNHHLVREYSERDIRSAHQELMARARITGQKYRARPEHLIRFLHKVRREEHRLLRQMQTASPDGENTTKAERTTANTPQDEALELTPYEATRKEKPEP